MRLEVLCVSRRPPRWVSEATDEYARRLPRNFALEFVYLAPGHERAAAPARKREEGERLLRRAAACGILVALDERGREHDSRAFAAALAELRADHPRIALAIGGADGLDASVLDAAAARWSLSRLTLPHWLVQVLVAEQVYRAWSILEGHPYHRD